MCWQLLQFLRGFAGDHVGSLQARPLFLAAAAQLTTGTALAACVTPWCSGAAGRATRTHEEYAAISFWLLPAGGHIIQRTWSSSKQAQAKEAKISAISQIGHRTLWFGQCQLQSWLYCQFSSERAVWLRQLAKSVAYFRVATNSRQDKP